MISPLKTWQHHEPKGLWPALGGLAVVAHIGVLGLSLPYMIELMQPNGSSAQSTVPIELIELEEEPAVEETVTESAQVAQPLEPAQSSQPTQPETASTTERTVVAEQGNVRSLNSEATESEAPEPAEPSEPVEPQRSEQTETASTDNVETPSESSDSEGTSDATNESEEASNSETSGENGGSDEGIEASGDPPVVAGDSDLPTPGEGESASADSFAYLNIVDHDYVPIELQRDIPDTLPSPLYEAVTSLTVNPLDTRCGPIDFSQQQVTYRATIQANGTLISAIPWTGTIEEQPVSASEQAVSCLLTAANFSFTPATKSGTPVTNSDLLLKINVLESRQN